MECEAFTGLPRDRISLNNWIRNYYTLYHILNGAIRFHSSYSIGEFKIRVLSDKCYNGCISILETLDLARCKEDSFKPGTNLLVLSKEYWLLGEVFPLVNFKDREFHEEEITFLNPDAVFIRNDMVTKKRKVLLRPDSALHKLMKSTNPADVKVRNNLPTELVDSINKDNSIPLDEEEVSSIIRLSSPYDLRGTSIVLPVLKELVLFDKLREAGLPTDDCVNNIYRGLLFSRDMILNTVAAYVDYRYRVSRWLTNNVLLPIMKKNFSIEDEDISIEWKDIDLEDLESHLWLGKEA